MCLEKKCRDASRSVQKIESENSMDILEEERKIADWGFAGLVGVRVCCRGVDVSEKAKLRYENQRIIDYQMSVSKSWRPSSEKEPSSRRKDGHLQYREQKCTYLQSRSQQKKRIEEESSSVFSLCLAALNYYWNSKNTFLQCLFRVALLSGFVAMHRCSLQRKMGRLVFADRWLLN